ncbi:hypothetical protein ENBRE01_2075 [Enteropsectra breve]|nr:hypothetical protein ENBRE01_2075 [Enteropsectra breve]
MTRYSYFIPSSKKGSSSRSDRNRSDHELDPKKEFILKCDTVLVDGTFKVVPRDFTQLLSFNGILFGRAYPLVYIILSNKREESYLEAFNVLKEQVNFNPANIVCDFERSLINGL